MQNCICGPSSIGTASFGWTFQSSSITRFILHDRHPIMQASACRLSEVISPTSAHKPPFMAPVASLLPFGVPANARRVQDSHRSFGVKTEEYWTMSSNTVFVCVRVCVCVKKNWPSSNNFPKQWGSRHNVVMISSCSRCPRLLCRRQGQAWQVVARLVELAPLPRDYQVTTTWLVVWTPLKNISQLGWLFPIYAKIKNVPNHQPATISPFCSRLFAEVWGILWTMMKH